VARFALVSHWHLAAPIDPVWDAIYGVEHWPEWWRYVLKVESIEPGDADGVGALRRYTWGSRLPYQLTFEMRVTRLDKPRTIEGTAAGELCGQGRWTLSPVADTTRVRYDWVVSATRPWMNLLAPILAPAFRWNHSQVMAAGARGLARHLGVRLLSAQ